MSDYDSVAVTIHGRRGKWSVNCSACRQPNGWPIRLGRWANHRRAEAYAFAHKASHAEQAAA